MNKHHELFLTLSFAVVGPTPSKKKFAILKTSYLSRIAEKEEFK